jgi:hypothetical protein
MRLYEIAFRTSPCTRNKHRTASYSFVHVAAHAINYLCHLHNLCTRQICTASYTGTYTAVRTIPLILKRIVRTP